MKALIRDVLWSFGFVPKTELEREIQRAERARDLMVVATDQMRADLLIKVATMQQQLDIMSQRLKKRDASLNRTSVKVSYYKKQYLRYRFGTLSNNAS